MNAEQAQRTAHRFSTLLAQRQVVLAASTFVGMTFDRHLSHLVRREVFGVRLNHALKFGFDHKAVKVEINDFGCIGRACAGDISRANLNRSHTAGRSTRIPGRRPDIRGASIFYRNIFKLDVGAAGGQRRGQDQRGND